MNEKESQTFAEKAKTLIHKFAEKKLIVFSVAGVIVATATAVAIYSSQTDNGNERQMGQRFGVSDNSVMTEYVTASGTTSLGFTIDEFEPDYIETEIYIEEVYLSSGDEVTEGMPVLKVSEESIAEAREELEEKKTETSLAYRAGLISYEQSKINAKYTYDAAVLEGQQAEAVYNSAVKDAEEKLQQAKDKVTETEENIEEYGNAYAGYYYDYNVDKYKERYDNNNLYYNIFLGEYGFEESDLTGSGMGGQNAGTGSSTGSGDAPKESGNTENSNTENSASNDTGSSDTGTGGNSDTGTGGNSDTGTGGNSDTGTGGDSDTGIGGDSDTGTGGSSDTGTGGSSDTGTGGNSDTGTGGDSNNEGTTPASEGENDNLQASSLLSLFADWNTTLSRLKTSAVLGDGYSLVSVTTANQTDENYTRRLKIIQQMKKNLEASETYYFKAWNEYEAAANQANSQVAQLKIQIESLRAALAEAETTYQLEIIEAETTYKKALAQAELAQSDYSAAMQKAEDELEALEDEKTEAEENLAEFEALLGDGYLYTQNAGTVMMIGARSESNLQGGSMVVAYRNAGDISVTVSVAQEDIYKLEVGDSAQVIVEDYGTFEGQITYLNPISNSDSRTNITYEVIVDLSGENIDSLTENLTATVIFYNSSALQTGDSSQ